MILTEHEPIVAWRKQDKPRLQNSSSWKRAPVIWQRLRFKRPGFVSNRRSFDMRYASDPSNLVKQKTNKNPASPIHGTKLRRPDRHASGKR